MMKEYISLVFMKIFIQPTFFWFPAGLPFLKLGDTFFYKDFPMKRFSKLKGGWMRKWRERLEQSNQDRTENASYFNKCLHVNTPGGNRIPYLRLPIVVESVEKRDRIYAISRERGLGLSIMYPTAINEIGEIRANFYGQEFPFAREVAERILTVPVHPLLSDRDKIAITELINGFST